MNNVRSIITNHNTRIIRKSQTQITCADNCNCRNKEACPLQNKCMNKDIVYEATISTSKTISSKNISYTGGSKRCNLCLEEKLNILKEKDNCLLNKRSEIISACLHKTSFQVKNLNKEKNACYFNDNTPTFPP